MPGVITTFYSFKGGVGRTALLSNVAVLLSRWGFRVLCIDWDIEAPGLDEYFRPWMGQTDTPGLVDLVTDFAEKREVPWQTYCSRLSLPQTTGSLDVMSAGRPADDYIARAQRLDWRELFDEQGFGEHLEALREEWKEAYDFVLIDSRTGITDIGGICTVHLPDMIVSVFTANRQSLDGVIKVLGQAQARRDALPLNRAGLSILPVPSRIDSRVQEELSKTWLRTFAERLEPLYDAWLDTEISPRQMIDLTRVPYFSSWSFGERLATLEERENDPEAISYHYGTVAALIAQRLGSTDQLLRGRDIYVESARTLAGQQRRSGYDYYFSYSSASAALVHQVADRLGQAGQTVVSDPAVASADWRSVLEALAASRAAVFFVDPAHISPWQSVELGFAVAQGGTERAIHIVSLVRLSDLPFPFARYLAIDAQELTPEEIVARLVPDSAPGTARSDQGSLADLARRYENVHLPNYADRVRVKDALAEELGTYVLKHQISRKQLVETSGDAMAVALAEAADRAPEPGDLARLVKAGSEVKRLHPAYRILLAVGRLVERERLDADMRKALDDLLTSYDHLAREREDSPLTSLVGTVRRRVANLT